MKKYIFGITVSIMAVFVFIALLPLQASVSNNESLKLPAKATAAIDVEIPKAFGEKVSSLQLSLEVTNADGTQADADVLKEIEKLSFSPDEAVASKAKICEGRYHKDTGILDIYIAGTEPLFSENAALAVGTVNAVFQNDKNADIYVKVTDESLKVVKGIILKTITDEPDAVRIQVAGLPVEPEESLEPPVSQSPEQSEKPEDPVQSQKPENSPLPEAPDETQAPENPDHTQVPGDPDVPQDPTKPVLDSSKLQAALEVAATLKEADYTPDSFALLKKAVEDSKNVLNNPNATQEELDQAADAIYNAIGMLVYTSSTSVQTNANNNPAVKSSNQEVKAALTGDNSPIGIYVAVLLVSIGVIAVVIAGKRRQDGSQH